MKLLHYVALFLGAAAATPLEVSPQALAADVKIRSISAVGSGCPLGHAYATIDASGTIFDIAFDNYVVEVGPGTSSSDARKNCRVTLNIEYPQGLTFSIIDTTFSGYAGLASGQRGTCRASYSFSGSQQSTAAQMTISGPADQNYEMNKSVDVISWSPCGDFSAIMNVNSEIRIAPITTPNKGVMTVDSFDGRLHVKFATNWRRC